MALPTPPAPIAMQCQLSVEQVSKLIKVLGIAEKSVNTLVKKIQSDIDQYVIEGVLSATEDIDERVTRLEDKYAGRLPDYLDKAANVGETLEKYSEDLNAVNATLQKCSVSRMKSILRSTGVVNTNNIPNVDKVAQSIYVSNSAIRASLSTLNKFNPAYLRQQKSQILRSFQNDILQIVDGLIEFTIATFLNSIESTMVSQVVENAKIIEQFLLCVAGVGCPEFIDLLDEYNYIMNRFPLYPQFMNAIQGQNRISPEYKLDAQTILNDTIASSDQKNNIMNCKYSITKSLNFSKNMTNNYTNPKFYFT